MIDTLQSIRFKSGNIPTRDAIASLSYDGLYFRNSFYRDSFPVYIDMVNIAFHHGAMNVLELGAGLSTALWARYASRTGAKITPLTPISALCAPTSRGLI